ncbi:MAG: sulfur carrier protein ThiS [Gemmatimonadota bacterium]
MNASTDLRRIDVTVNGETRTLPAGITVVELLKRLDLHPRLVVVERNREILDRDRYEGTRLDDGDALELVHFVGGG